MAHTSATGGYGVDAQQQNFGGPAGRDQEQGVGAAGLQLDQTIVVGKVKRVLPEAAITPNLLTHKHGSIQPRRAEPERVVAVGIVAVGPEP